MLRFRADYLPALIELSKLIDAPGFSRYNAIPIFRRAFLCNHRDWDLLQLFVKVTVEDSVGNKALSPQALVECAHALEKGEGYQTEIEAVYMWAL